MSEPDNSTALPFVKRMAWRVGVAAVFTWVLSWPIGLADDAKLGDMADSLAGAGGVFGGFLLTAATILAAVMDKKLVQDLRRTGHLNFLLVETYTGVVLFLALALSGSLTRLLSGEMMRCLAHVDVFLAVLGSYVLLAAGRKYFLLIQEM